MTCPYCNEQIQNLIINPMKVLDKNGRELQYNLTVLTCPKCDKIMPFKVN